MAASVMCRRVPRLPYLPGLRKDFIQAQHVPVKQENETDDQKGEKGVLQHQEASPHGEYRLCYNPSAYHCSVRNSSWCQMDNDEEQQCLPTLALSFWQQSNHYSVSTLRHFSSSKDTLLDLAFNKCPAPEMPSASPYQREPTQPDVKIDPRAFHTCRPEYASMTFDPTQRPSPIEWEEAVPVLQKVRFLKGSMKTTDVSQFLSKLSRLHPDKVSLMRNDQRFLMLLRYSVENLRLFDLHQLLEVIQSFFWLLPSVHSVLALYEAELSRRVQGMSLHQLLFAADLWRCIGRPVPEFLKHLCNSVNLHLGQIGAPELVQLLYIIGEGRHCPEHLIHPLEELLMCHLHQLYPEEVGAVCLGIFKCKTTLSQGAVTHIIDKAHCFVEEMSDLAMVNVLKFMRFNYMFHNTWLQAMAQEVPRRAHGMGIEGLMHVALALSALHSHDDDILMAIAERVPSLAPHCRSKDACKLLWAFGTFRFLPDQSPNFYPSLIEALRMKKAEFQRFPEHLLTGLLGLAFVSQFPEDLIKYALSSDYVSLALKVKKLDLRKDLFTLDETVALELPEWSGPRLSCELKEEIEEMLWKFAQDEMGQKPEVLEAESLLQHLLGGEEFVCKTMILPHTRTIDLEVHFDSTGQPIPLDRAPYTDTPSREKRSAKRPSLKGWRKMDRRVNITEKLVAQLMNRKKAEPFTQTPAVKPTSLHRLEPDDCGRGFDTGLDPTTDVETLTKPSSRVSGPQDIKAAVKLAIQVSSRNHYCYNSQVLLGLHALKRRHLELAGYRVVELRHWEWAPMLWRSTAEKLTYLQCKVYSNLQEFSDLQKPKEKKMTQILD